MNAHARRVSVLLLRFGVLAILPLAQVAPAAPAAAAPDAAAPAAPDASVLAENPIQAAVEKSVCTVTVQNKWGIQVGVATGYLMTNGKFAIADLALVSQPGVVLAILQFKDGATIACREFAMADAALDLVVLRVPADAPERAGLPLAAELPPLDGTAIATTAGWRWATQLETVSGNLLKGPALKDAATQARVDAPRAVEAFIRTDGPRLDAATGSAVLDQTGTVLGTLLEVTIHNTSAPLIVPSLTLRTALGAVQPQLKPLAELPKSPWPTRYLRLSGQPAGAAAITTAVADARKAMLCPRCGGRGTITIAGVNNALNAPGDNVLVAAPGGGGGGRGGGGGGRGGLGGGGRGGRGGGGGGGQGGNARRTEVCPTCRGEKNAMSDDLWSNLARLIQAGTRTIWAPTTEERVRADCRTQVRALLKSLTAVGPRFDKAFNTAAAANVMQVDAPLPRSALFCAQVKGHADGPDGKYLLLAPLNADVPVTVQVDDLMQLGGRSNLGDHRDPADGSWILVSGLVLSRFNDGKLQGFFILPLEWMPVAAPTAAPAAGAPAVEKA